MLFREVVFRYFRTYIVLFMKGCLHTHTHTRIRHILLAFVLKQYLLLLAQMIICWNFFHLAARDGLRGAAKNISAALAKERRKR